MSILIPLYVYPWPGVWDPLYWAAGNNTNLHFTAILNPCSGPCLPASQIEPAYLAEIPKLTSYPNIRTLGYVATNYTNKPIEDVMGEIRTYADWPRTLGDERVGVDGIFFDETPAVYDWRWEEYLKVAGEEVRANKGLGEGVVVHNPGNLPYQTWNYLAHANITVIFEDTFANFITSKNFYALKSLETTYGLPKDRFSIMLHSIPDVPDELVVWMVQQMKQMVGWGFASSVGVKGEYWHSFSPVFERFVSLWAWG
ncbi:uncharacterized protein EI97DRAFT_454241 [Westerdykella ornata]|uniref:Cell surface protein n=1 Tax=Westerdykella ornata TaxID=318751 RepID=A0A6A6JWM4_WESOR|nr:uncharacterized protein EI97DRAFT_454241 [Westerdykella ornata]KAF2281020.1 hypothetical protein EI97DRAFT_454241 [Westerdykella ornata]